jgi:hypothetical protein
VCLDGTEDPKSLVTAEPLTDIRNRQKALDAKKPLKQPMPQVEKDAAQAEAAKAKSDSGRAGVVPEAKPAGDKAAPPAGDRLQSRPKPAVVNANANLKAKGLPKHDNAKSAPKTKLDTGVHPGEDEDEDEEDDTGAKARKAKEEPFDTGSELMDGAFLYSQQRMIEAIEALGKKVREVSGLEVPVGVAGVGAGSAKGTGTR